MDSIFCENPPPNLNSKENNDALNEVKILGAKDIKIITKNKLYLLYFGLQKFGII